jgi:hypothetical protein
MKSLDEAWQWYIETKHLLRVIRRLADRHWNYLDWDGTLGKDDVLRNVEGPPLVQAADLGKMHLDDLAIVALFSVFESVVRDRLRIEIEEARQTIKHPVLQFASDQALHEINRGQFLQGAPLLEKDGPRPRRTSPANQGLSELGLPREERRGTVCTHTKGRI